MKVMYCKKRFLELQKNLVTCKECMQKHLSGFNDIFLCRNFNVIYVEEQDDSK